jgi:hypothetical protein
VSVPVLDRHADDFDAGADLAVRRAAGGDLQVVGKRGARLVIALTQAVRRGVAGRQHQCRQPAHLAEVALRGPRGVGGLKHFIVHDDGDLAGRHDVIERVQTGDAGHREQSDEAAV